MAPNLMLFVHVNMMASLRHLPSPIQGDDDEDESRSVEAEYPAEAPGHDDMTKDDTGYLRKTISLQRKSPAHQLTVAVHAISRGTWNKITCTGDTIDIACNQTGVAFDVR